jgi:hypothetical protein
MIRRGVLLPMLGSGGASDQCPAAANVHVRLMVAEACLAQGFRALAGLVKGVMQRWRRLQRWHRRVRPRPS